MRKVLCFISLCFLSSLSLSALARNEVLNFSIEEALASSEFSELVGSDVTFYFGSRSYPEPKQTFGTFGSNKKTNSFKKSDQGACRRALYSALISLRDRALAEGGDAVIKIVSNYKGRQFSSEKEFQCGAGSFVSGVALRGQVVRLK